MSANSWRWEVLIGHNRWSPSVLMSYSRALQFAGYQARAGSTVRIACFEVGTMSGYSYTTWHHSQPWTGDNIPVDIDLPLFRRSA